MGGSRILVHYTCMHIYTLKSCFRYSTHSAPGVPSLGLAGMKKSTLLSVVPFIPSARSSRVPDRYRWCHLSWLTEHCFQEEDEEENFVDLDRDELDEL